jgi:hypothetical protein
MGEAEDALRRVRRAVAKATHPDAGGDAETHRKAMEAVESAGAPPPSDPVRAVKKRFRDVVGLPKNMREAFKEGRDSDDELPD